MTDAKLLRKVEKALAKLLRRKHVDIADIDTKIVAPEGRIAFTVHGDAIGKRKVRRNNC